MISWERSEAKDSSSSLGVWLKSTKSLVSVTGEWLGHVTVTRLLNSVRR